MSATAILLLLAAALAHAAWNLLGKRASPSGAFFLIASLASVVVLGFLGIIYWNIIEAIPPRVWWLVSVAALFQAIYYVGLAEAYRRGHLSVAYPLARSLPILFVTAFNFSIGRGNQIGSIALIGMALVIVGCLLLPMRRFSDLKFSNYLHASSAMALLAAIGTTGYSLADNEALRHLREAGLATIGKINLSMLYLLLEIAATAIVLGGYVALSSRERRAWRDLRKRGIVTSCIAGVLISTAYGLTLASMAFVSNVSYVVAFRQISIPLAAVLGVVLLNEPFARPKVTGILVLMLGLALVALG